MKKNKPENFMKALMLKEFEDRMKNFILLVFMAISFVNYG